MSNRICATESPQKRERNLVSPEREARERPRRALRPIVLLAWAFVVWSELTAVPPGRRDLLVLQPVQRFEFATFSECDRARDFLLPFLAPAERATGCEEVR